MKKVLFFLSFILFSFPIFAQHTIEVHHKYYTLEYDTILKSPLESYYIQTTAYAKGSLKIDRKTVAKFQQDPLINAKYQVANDKVYRGNGKFDKGHLSPYSAFQFELVAAKESMYYTNTAPQYSFFNEHSWEKLEMHVLKELAPKIDSIKVYTGCLYGSGKMNGVPIPDYYWKAVIYNNITECYLAKNEAGKVSDWKTYEVNADSLKNTILSYYPKLKLF